MAVVNHQLFVFDNGRKIKDSNDLEMIVKALAVSADGNNNGLTISEASGKFNFNSKVLGGVATPTANGEVLIFDMLGANSGIATLDSGGKIPVGQLPNSVMEYKGTYDPTAAAGAGVPALANGTGNAGDTYKVTAAGSHDFGAGAVTFVVGDYVIYSGSVWELAHSGADAVISVNSQSGAVSLDSDDIGEGTTNLYFTASRAKTAAVADAITDAVTDVAPSQNAVFDALALKANDSVVVKTVNGASPTAGAVTIDSDDVGEGTTNLYFTASRAKSAAVADSITDGVTDVAPSQNAVFDALALKADASALGGSQYASFTNKELAAITVRKFVKMLVAGEVTLLAAADAVNDESFFGCVKDASIAADAAGSVFLPEVGARVTGFTGLDVTKLLYASTAGGYTQTRPTTGKVIILGKAVSATEIIFIGRFEAEYV